MRHRRTIARCGARAEPTSRPVARAARAKHRGCLDAHSGASSPPGPREPRARRLTHYCAGRNRSCEQPPSRLPSPSPRPSRRKSPPPAPERWGTIGAAILHFASDDRRWPYVGFDGTFRVGRFEVQATYFRDTMQYDDFDPEYAWTRTLEWYSAGIIWPLSPSPVRFRPHVLTGFQMFRDTTSHGSFSAPSPRHFKADSARSSRWAGDCSRACIHDARRLRLRGDLRRACWPCASGSDSERWRGKSKTVRDNLGHGSNHVESGRVAFWYLPIADSCPLGRGSGATLPRVENAVIGNGGHVPARVATRRPG